MTATDPASALIAEIARCAACQVVDDVAWDGVAGAYRGSFLWHGVPTTPAALAAFAEFALGGTGGPPAVVAAVSSSGIAWGAALALRAERPLGVLRLAPHRYGVWNADLRRHRGRTAWLVDNYYGSGETLAEAERLLRGMGIEVTRRLVVEAADADVRGVSAALDTDAKLDRLVAQRYFAPLGTEVVARYRRDRRTWLDDAEWVQTVKRRVAAEPSVAGDAAAHGQDGATMKGMGRV
jgi:adenine/guanine phosphoribosyltransferase-like PRPP-binding protein